jgi:hypothetical protein
MRVLHLCHCLSNFVEGLKKTSKNFSQNSHFPNDVSCILLKVQLLDSRLQSSVR